MANIKKQVRFHNYEPVFPRPELSKNVPQTNFFKDYDSVLKMPVLAPPPAPVPCSRLELSIIEPPSPSPPPPPTYNASNRVISPLREIQTIQTFHREKDSTPPTAAPNPKSFNFFTLPDSNLALLDGKPILDTSYEKRNSGKENHNRREPDFHRNVSPKPLPTNRRRHSSPCRASERCQPRQESIDSCCNRSVRKCCEPIPVDPCNCRVSSCSRQVAAPCCKAPDNGLAEKTQAMEKLQPSVSDLYEIIKMQNQQLTLLQERVDRLLEEKKTQVVEEIVETQSTFIQAPLETHKISIGVMTSFEFTINNAKPESTQNHDNILEGIKKIDLTHSPAPEKKKTVDVAVSPISQTREKMINMEDYSDSEEDSSPPNNNNNNTGWTFYNNILNRVNHILTSPPQQSIPETHPQRPEGRLLMHQYKSSKKVTMETTSPDFSKPMSETSLHMMRLAGKYLGTPQRVYHEAAHPAPAVCNEMSFATKQYMQRYHLISVPEGSGRPYETPPRNQHLDFAYHKGPSKILDITAIKRQPKLL